MTIIIVIGVVLGIGALVLLRSPAPATPQTGAMTPADAAALREAVLARLQERLAGWRFDVPADSPYELTAIDAATERRIQMNLQRLGEAWFPFHSRGQTEQAEEQINAFILGATGQGEGSDQELDAEGLRDVLALQLTKPDGIPTGGLSRPAGSLTAVLVMRNLGGFDTVHPSSLESLGVSESEAFGIAFENMQRDVEEGLDVAALDEDDPPGAVGIAPSDPLAPAYALVPQLADRIKHKLGGQNAKLYVDAGSLVAAVEGTEVEREKPLLPDPQPLDALAWTAPPA